MSEMRTITMTRAEWNAVIYSPTAVKVWELAQRVTMQMRVGGGKPDDVVTRECDDAAVKLITQAANAAGIRIALASPGSLRDQETTQ